MKDTDQDQSHSESGRKVRSSRKAQPGSSSASNAAFQLQRTVGNRVVADVMGLEKVQRQAKHSSSGSKAVQLQVIWTEDSTEFLHRVVAAISRQTGIPQSTLWQGADGPVHRLHARLMRNLELKPGRPISVTGKVTYDSSAIVAEVGELESAATATSAAPGQKAAPPPPRDEDLPKPGETRDQRLQRQAATTARVLAQEVADADARGWASINIKIEHTGEELSPGFEKLGPQSPRPSGTTPVTAETVLKEHLKPELDMILMSGKGVYQIQFSRNAQGRFTFLYFGRVEPRARGMTEREELDALGIPDRRKIYAQIFSEANEVLKEQAIKAAGFTAEQIVLWIAGGVIFRVLGLLGAGAVRGFPILARALRLGRTANITRAMASLGEAEGGELATLLEQSEKGRLSPQQLTRAGELLAKVEKALGLEIPTLRTISRVSENPTLVREAERISADAQREVNTLLEQYLNGNTNPGLGNKSLGKGIFYLRGRNGGRIFLRENADGYLEILGKSDKGNEETVIKTILEQFQ